MIEGIKVWLDIMRYGKLDNLPKDLKELNEVEYILLTPFIFGKYKLTDYDIDFINREVVKLPLNTLSKIFNILTKSEKTKIIPVFDLYNRIDKQTYLAIASNGSIKLKYVIYPKSMIYDLALMENALRNAEWGALEVDKGDIIIHSSNHIEYNQDIYNNNLLIIPNERIAPTKSLRGIEVGKFETYSKIVLLQIKDNVYIITKNNIELIDTMNYVKIVSILNNTEFGKEYKYIDFIKSIENGGEPPKEVEKKEYNKFSKLLQKNSKMAKEENKLKIEK